MGPQRVGLQPTPAHTYLPLLPCPAQPCDLSRLKRARTITAEPPPSIHTRPSVQAALEFSAMVMSLKGRVGAAATFGLSNIPLLNLRQAFPIRALVSPSIKWELKDIPSLIDSI